MAYGISYSASVCAQLNTGQKSNFKLREVWFQRWYDSMQHMQNMQKQSAELILVV